jgi:hypothetical protein
MTQAHICQSMTLADRPLCNVAALMALRGQLDAWKRADTTRDGNSATEEGYVDI